MKRVVAAVVVLLALTATPARAATHDVAITSTGFKNGTCDAPSGNEIARVTVGDTVRWTNCDASPHNVTSDSFQSGALAPGQSYSHAFAKDGFFYYRSAGDEFARGTVVVQPNPSPSTRPADPRSPTTTVAPSASSSKNTGTTGLTLGTITTLPQGATTIVPTTDTTEANTAPIANKDGGASGGLLALTILAIAAVVGGGVYVVRRMRSG